MTALIKIAPPAPKAGLNVLYQMHCPMVNADWLQATAAISNPYEGQAMATCGSVVHKTNLKP